MYRGPGPNSNSNSDSAPALASPCSGQDASKPPSDNHDDAPAHELTKGDMPDAATIDRSGTAA
eukprot:COSAG05_NODE_11232_length_523_cov_1.771226_1_plen_62_part_10